MWRFYKFTHSVLAESGDFIAALQDGQLRDVTKRKDVRHNEGVALG